MTNVRQALSMRQKPHLGGAQVQHASIEDVGDKESFSVDQELQ